MKGRREEARTLEALRAWRELEVPELHASLSEPRRREVLPLLEQQILDAAEAARSSVARRRMLVSVAAAAAAVALVVAWQRWPSGGHPQPPAPRAGHVQARAGDLWTTGEGSGASLVLASGATVALAPSGQLAYEQASESEETLALDHGSVSLRVPKLGAARRLSVRTPDAQVVVHGTAFTVSFALPGEPARTRVAVTEGLVSVRCRGEDERFIPPGESYQCGAREPLAAPAEAPQVTPDPTTARHPRDAARARRDPPAAATPPPASLKAKSSLAEENRAFGDAMSARRDGDDRRALKLLQGFVDEYPGSVLAEEAGVEQFRAFARLGEASNAARSAGRYLAAYRDGFARDEARRLVFGGTADAAPHD